MAAPAKKTPPLKTVSIEDYAKADLTIFSKQIFVLYRGEKLSGLVQRAILDVILARTVLKPRGKRTPAPEYACISTEDFARECATSKEHLGTQIPDMIRRGLIKRISLAEAREMGLVATRREGEFWYKVSPEKWASAPKYELQVKKPSVQLRAELKDERDRCAKLERRIEELDAERDLARKRLEEPHADAADASAAARKPGNTLLLRPGGKLASMKLDEPTQKISFDQQSSVGLVLESTALKGEIRFTIRDDASIENKGDAARSTKVQPSSRSTVDQADQLNPTSTRRDAIVTGCAHRAMYIERAMANMVDTNLKGCPLEFWWSDLDAERLKAKKKNRTFAIEWLPSTAAATHQRWTAKVAADAEIEAQQQGERVAEAAACRASAASATAEEQRHEAAWRALDGLPSAEYQERYEAAKTHLFDQFPKLRKSWSDNNPAQIEMVRGRMARSMGLL